VNLPKDSESGPVEDVSNDVSLSRESKRTRRSTHDLAAAVYEELRVLAHHYRRRQNQGRTTMPTTAVVHEAYLRLSKGRGEDWATKEEFLAVAAMAVRHFLIDAARRKNAVKRGGGQSVYSFDEVEFVLPDTTIDLLALNDCLSELAHLNPLHAQIVELRFFGGMTLDQTAGALHMTVGQVRSEWRWAKAWLHKQLGNESDINQRNGDHDS